MNELDLINMQAIRAHLLGIGFSYASVDISYDLANMRNRIKLSAKRNGKSAEFSIECNGGLSRLQKSDLDSAFSHLFSQTERIYPRPAARYNTRQKFERPAIRGVTKAKDYVMPRIRKEIENAEALRRALLISSLGCSFVGMKDAS